MKSNRPTRSTDEAVVAIRLAEHARQSSSSLRWITPSVGVTAQLRSTLLAMSVNRQRLAHLRKAAAAAILRLEAVELDPEAAFGPLGESLTWICAQDELLEREVPTDSSHRSSDSTGKSLLGLRFARNHLIHGVNVSTVAQFDGGAVLARAILPIVLGAPPCLRWIPASDLPSLSKPQPTQERAYELLLQGKAILPTLREAQAFLAVASTK